MIFFNFSSLDRLAAKIRGSSLFNLWVVLAIVVDSFILMACWNLFSNDSRNIGFDIALWVVVAVYFVTFGYFRSRRGRSFMN